ncbi:hypothetical protein CGZ94_04955 [Enemella evansiae]|uniref:Uncharacterized protein n=1 Tax=Enemella evansiae TaxID=2016499 RepID=A0A255GLL6_9ACTN|nr:hypothetical protein [Enemella evansiae]OYO16292.1 hypothetical protein CGZ94_04955 [Enemella evansiae]
MANDTIPTTSEGIPFLDTDTFLRATPDYTTRLADWLRGLQERVTTAALNGTIPKGPNRDYVLHGLLGWRKLRDHHRAALWRSGDQIIQNDQWTRIMYNGAPTLEGSVSYDSNTSELVLGAVGLWLVNEIHHWVGAGSVGPLESKLMLNGNLIPGTLMSNNLSSAFSQSVSRGIITGDTSSRLRTEVNTRNGSARAIYGAHAGFTALEAIYLGPVIT